MGQLYMSSNDTQLVLAGQPSAVVPSPLYCVYLSYRSVIFFGRFSPGMKSLRIGASSNAVVIVDRSHSDGRIRDYASCCVGLDVRTARRLEIATKVTKKGSRRAGWRGGS